MPVSTTSTYLALPGRDSVDLARFRGAAEIFREETEAARSRSLWWGRSRFPPLAPVERVSIAYELGFRCFQIALPCWGALNDVELLAYFRDVCGAFPDASFLHYNLPRAKRVLNGADYRRLVDAVANLVGTKNTGGGLARADDLMTHAPELQHFFGEQNVPPGCFDGECSLLSSLAAIAPDATRQLVQAGRNRDYGRLFRLQMFFHQLLQGLLGDLLALDRIDGAYDKIWVRLGGLEEMPLRLLSPYQCFSEEQYQACKTPLPGKIHLRRIRGVRAGSMGMIALSIRFATAAAALSALSLRSDEYSPPDHAGAVLDIGSRRELFLDRFVIDRLEGKAELRLHHPEPREIVMRRDAPWEGSGSGMENLFRDGDRFPHVLPRVANRSAA